MSRSEQGKALAVAGLSFTCSALLEVAVKTASQWWAIMIALAIGLSFMLVGFVYARRMGDRDQRAAEAKEKSKEDAAKTKEDAERHRQYLEWVAQREQQQKEKTASELIEGAVIAGIHGRDVSSTNQHG